MGGERGERGVVAGLEGFVLRTEGERVVLLLKLQTPETAMRGGRVSVMGGAWTIARAMERVVRCDVEHTRACHHQHEQGL